MCVSSLGRKPKSDLIRLITQHEDEVLTTVALQPIPKGQQVFSDNGQLPRFDLLVSRRFKVIPLLAEISNLSCEALLERIVFAEHVLGRQFAIPRNADTGNMKRRYGYVTEDYKKWDVVEVHIETIFSTVSQKHRLRDRDQNARVSKIEPG